MNINIYDKTDGKWYCQLSKGCLMFALVNSGIVSNKLFSNLPYKYKQHTTRTIKSVKEDFYYDFNVLCKWIQLSNQIMHKKDLDYLKSLLGRFKKIENSKNLTDDNKIRNLTFLNNEFKKNMKNCYDIEKDKNYLSKLHLPIIDIKDDTNIEQNDIIGFMLDTNLHWVVAYDVSDKTITCIDSTKQRLMKYPKSKFTKLIKYKNLSKITDNLTPFDVSLMNSSEFCKELKKYVFSEQFELLIEKIKHINFSILTSLTNQEEIIDKLENETRFYDR